MGFSQISRNAGKGWKVCNDLKVFVVGFFAPSRPCYALIHIFKLCNGLKVFLNGQGKYIKPFNLYVYIIYLYMYALNM